MKVIDYYQQELNRIAWRIQYRAKKEQKHVISLELVPDLIEYSSFSENSDNKVMLQHYMNQLPSKIGKKVIYEIYINDKTEAQVAQELHISQQAVNKWKRKMIRELSRMITS